MLKLSDRGTVPPGGFKYLNQETTTWISAASFMELIAAVTHHRRANNLPVSSEIEALIEDQLCSRMPPGTCNHQSPQALSIKPLTLQGVMEATKIIGSFLAGGRKTVPIGESNARANICSGCPFNQPVSSCTTCSMNTIRGLVESIVGGEKTDADPMLGVCFACGCSLKAKVRIPLDLLHKHMSSDSLSQLPDWCWAKKP